MKIRSITLTNYRLYKGVNEIVFDSDDKKNIFLISGQNGFGKTTFLHSLLWCLYGRLMVEIDESIRKDVLNCGGYNALLQSNLNILNKQKLQKLLSVDEANVIKKKGYTCSDLNIKENSTYSVAIEFTDVLIPSVPCHSLKITRSFDTLQCKENLDIKIDGVNNELSEGIGNEVFINDFILNKDIARFFFFDSERIVSMAETNTIEEKRKLSSAYNEVLGVKKYEDLKHNLENMRLRFRKKSSDIIGRDKLNSLLEEQKQIQEKIDAKLEDIARLEESLVDLKRTNESYQIKLIREGNNNTIEELHRLEMVLSQTRKKDLEYKNQLKLFLDYAPFAISGTLFELTREQVIRDYEIQKTSQNVQNQNILLSTIGTDLSKMLDDLKIDQYLTIQLQEKIKSVLAKHKGIDIKDVQLIDINKEDYQEFMAIYNNITSTYKSEFRRLTDDYRKNKLILERSMRQISLMQNKESDLLIKSIRAKKDEVEKSISETEDQIRILYGQSGDYNRELAIVNKKISEMKKKVSLDDGNIAKDKLAEQLSSELDNFLISLKKEKKYSLETRIKKALNSLMHKEDFIGSVKVKIIDDGLDIDLYSPECEKISKDSLSKGEQQLYATSILKALVEESGIEFPVFIDSPLQKFDKSHSRKIITEFYPSISKQVILFPLMHKELTEDELDVMMPLVKSAYIIKNESSHSYFKKIDVGQLMQE